MKDPSVDRSASPSQTFSPIRILGFDVTMFIIVDADTNSVKSAFEWSPTEDGRSADGRTTPRGMWCGSVSSGQQAPTSLR